MGWRGWASGGSDTKRKLYPRKRHFFDIEKYVEDVKQEEKDVPDLLESIMRPTDPVKEELRQKLFKIDQFESKIKKMRVSTFWIPEIRSFPAGGQHNLPAQLVLSKKRPPQTRINLKNAGFERLQALFTQT